MQNYFQTSLFYVVANCFWYTRIITICIPEGLILAFEPNKYAFNFSSEFCSPNFLTLPVAFRDNSYQKEKSQ